MYQWIVEADVAYTETYEIEAHTREEAISLAEGGDLSPTKSVPVWGPLTVWAEKVETDE